jgi:hypothetical protein
MARKSSQNVPKNAKIVTQKGHKSAPSSPVGTPRKLVNTKKVTENEDILEAQWTNFAYKPAAGFTTNQAETPSEETGLTGLTGFPGKITGCCGRTTGLVGPTRRSRSSSYSALDSTTGSEDSRDYETKTSLPKKQPVSPTLFTCLPVSQLFVYFSCFREHALISHF